MTTARCLDHALPRRFSRISKVLRFLATGILLGIFLGNAAAQSQTELTQTSQAELTQANAALSEFATTYKSHLSAEQVTLFQKAQKTWDAFRQADCAFKVSGVAGGSAYPMIMADCLRGAAEARLKALQTLEQCEEGELACPAPKLE